MPWFDLGTLPDTYDPSKDEAFQVVMAPRPTAPTFAVCKFDEFNSEFNWKKFMLHFHEFDFVKHGVNAEEVESTIKLATSAMEPFHGVMNKKARIKYIILSVVFIIFLALALLAGLIPSMKGDRNNRAARWFWPLFLMAVYLVGFFVASYFLNR